jgi:hypothetical protein
MATAAVLASAGDVIAQRLEGLSGVAFGRMLTLVAVNVAYITPILTVFYALNEWLCGQLLKLPSGTVKGTAARLAFDQLLNAPIVIFGFFWSFGIFSNLIATPLSGGAVASLPSVAAATMALVTREYRATVLKNWIVWVPPQCLNFAVVPPKLRVPFASLVALVWNVITSLVANSK